MSRACNFIARLALPIVAAALLLVPAVASAAVPPVQVSTVGGASAVTVSWPSNDAAPAYLVWRTTDPSDPALSRVVGRVFEDAAASDDNVFSDFTAAFGGRYRYAVTVVGADAAAPSPSDWTFEPVALSVDFDESTRFHVRAEYNTTTCRQCHDVDKTADGSSFADLGQDDATDAALCLSCHDGPARPGLASVGAAFALEAGSGHSLEELSCADCHAQHASSATSVALFGPTVKTPSGDVVDVPQDAVPATNGRCVACHSAASGDVAQPSYDASGYPVANTFPGRSVFEGSFNVHASIVATGTYTDVARPAGDCLYCHSSHKSASPYDGLLIVGDLATLPIEGRADVDVASLCASCHPDAVAGDDEQTMGHRIRTAGGFYEPGDDGVAVPCFGCHGPHGSSRGNAYNLSDALGADLDPSASPQKLVQFCFTCHVSPDGYGWDSQAQAFAPVSADASVFGLSRAESVIEEPLGTSTLAGPSLAFGNRSTTSGAEPPQSVPSRLRLRSMPQSSDPSQDPHDWRYEGSMGCVDCHKEIHAPDIDPQPTSGSCYDCHQELRSMDRSNPVATSTFQHAMGSSASAYSGGVLLAEFVATRSANPSSMYCLTCHTAHEERTGNSYTLRSTANTGAGADSDVGLCLSCHDTALARTAIGQKAAFTFTNSPTRITSVRAIDPSDYVGASKHDYEVTTPSGTKGNCIKCHNDAGVVGNSSLKNFALHSSSNQSLIARIGDESNPITWNTIPAQYKLCFQCHARYGDVDPATEIGKNQAGKDWYGARTIGTRAAQFYRSGILIGSSLADDQAVFSDMFRVSGGSFDLEKAIPAERMTVSGHQSEREFRQDGAFLKDWYKTSTTAVRCSDCHDVHATTHGVMGVGQEWPLTRKPLPPSTSQFAGTATLRSRILAKGTDDSGNRLITLNDIFYRDSLRKQLETSGKFSAVELDKGMVTGEMIVARGLSSTLAQQWDSTVSVFCFQCHSESALSGKNHSADLGGSGPGDGSLNHKNGLLPCVGCHVPAVHGSGMPMLLADAGSSTGSQVMPSHQVFRWYDHYSDTYNAPTASLLSVKMDELDGTKPQGCATPTNRCHSTLPGGWKVQGNQTGTGWSNWQSSF